MSDGITHGPGLVLRPWCDLLHTQPTAKHSLDLYEPGLYLGQSPMWKQVGSSNGKELVLKAQGFDSDHEFE